MKALVTGVAGFIGSHLAERLLRDGHDVIGVDDFSAGYYQNVPKGVKLFCKDVGNINSDILVGVEVVFHNAASKKNICLKNPVRDMEVNGVGTLRLLQECVNSGVTKFVHASTGSVYGEVAGKITEDTPKNPCSYYGISKLAGESYVNYYSKYMNITILRYFHVYGDRQESSQEFGGVVAIFTEKIKQGRPLIVYGDGNQKRVFTSVGDIVEANIQAWTNSISSGKIYNCASSHRTTINQLADILMEKYKKAVYIEYAEPLEGDIYEFNVDNSRISELGVKFKPITEVL